MQLFQCIFVGVRRNVQANYMWKLMTSLKVEKSMFWKFISAVDVKDNNVFRITNADTDNRHYRHHHHSQLYSGWQPRGWRSWVRAWSLDKGLSWDIDFHRFFFKEQTSLYGGVGFGFFGGVWKPNCPWLLIINQIKSNHLEDSLKITLRQS